MTPSPPDADIISGGSHPNHHFNLTPRDTGLQHSSVPGTPPPDAAVAYVAVAVLVLGLLPRPAAAAATTNTTLQVSVTFISVLRSHSLHLQHWARPIQLNHKLCNQISDYKKVRIKKFSKRSLFELGSLHSVTKHCLYPLFGKGKSGKAMYISTD